MTTSTEYTPGQVLMRSIIQRVATGPELSKDISFDEARAGLDAVLNGEIDPVQTSVFLIALRMKRETDEENRGILQALLDHADIVTADVDDVVDIADPYDGYTRSLPASPFLPAVLSACGLPAVSHGLDAVGPKFGVTHRHVLQAAGANVHLTPAEAAQRISDDSIGWSYVDQRVACKGLHDLVPLRTKIIKRQVLTTVEVLLGPVRGKKKTHLVTGYVHKPYPPVYASLARQAGFDSALLIRGVEGGVIPSLRQSGKAFAYHDMGAEEGFEFEPVQAAIEQDVRAPMVPAELPRKIMFGDEISESAETAAAARASADAGLEALGGGKNVTADALAYSGALILKHLGRAEDIAEGAGMIRKVLTNGSAMARFQSLVEKNRVL